MIETGNSEYFDRIYLKCNLPNKGEHSFQIKGTYLDELAHNTNDHGGSELGVIIDYDNIYIGNNSHPMVWDQLLNNYIDFKPVSHNSSTTGYWGVGGSKKFVYKHGILDYHCSIEDGKYLLRKFEYNGFEDMTYKSIDSKVTSFSVKEYSISREEYDELTFSNQFTSTPTWFISIKRYSDCSIGMRHNPENIIKYLNSSFMNVVNFKAWMKLGINGKKYQTKKVYYPTVIEDSDGIYNVPSHYSDLEKIRERWEIIPNVFVDVYFFKRIIQEKDGVAWVELASKTNDGNDIYYVSHRGGRKQNPRHIYINHRDVILSNEDVNSDITTDRAYYGHFVIKLVQGELEYNTMKTSGISPDIHEQVVAYYKEWLDINTNRNYSSRKGEDSKADDIVSKLLGEDSQYKTNLESAIRYMTNKELDEDVLNEERYYSVRETYNNREHDLIIMNENNEPIIHFEFQNDKEDWKHIDGFSTRSIMGVAKYNVMVVDSLSNSNVKRNYVTNVFEKSDVQNTWFVTYSDLLKNKRNSFVKLT